MILQMTVGYQTYEVLGMFVNVLFSARQINRWKSKQPENPNPNSGVQNLENYVQDLTWLPWS